MPWSAGILGGFDQQAKPFLVRHANIRSARATEGGKILSKPKLGLAFNRIVW